MKRKGLIISSLIFLMSMEVFAVPKYISPNNDGIKDILTIPLKISENRYVQGWSLVITDAEGNKVQTIGNKVALPEKLTFKSFFKQLVTPKEGVEIPKEVKWTGTMANGETAPDGLYYYYVTATDDNGNEGVSKKREVIIDTKAPDIKITQPSYKIFGEGAKSTLTIKQTGSVEDLWEGFIRDSAGNVVKTIKWENMAPSDFVWKGTTDTGAQVQDGIYTYEISATDKAGNKSPTATVTNIIYSGDKPSTNIYVKDSKYFSPNTDSELKSILFSLFIQIPEEKTGNKLVEWAVKILDEKNHVVKIYNETNTGLIPPKEIIFEGIDDNGNLLPDGKYRATVSAKYLNGYVPTELYSPFVVLDREKPLVQIEVSDKIFGAGAKNTVTFPIMIAPNSGAPIKQWQGFIKKSDDKSVVKTYEFGEYPPEEIVWNGICDSGDIAESGDYIFEIVGEDLAGNVGGGISSQIVTFDTTETHLLLNISHDAFSPNGDRIKDTVKFTPVTATRDVISYNFAIQDKQGNVVYNINAKGRLPVAFEWNGKGNDKVICDDGEYSANLSVTAANGSVAIATTQLFQLDTVSPNVSGSIPWNYFSTTGNGNQKNIPIAFDSCTDEKQWNVEVRNSNDMAIYTSSWSGIKDNFIWDGTDNSGNTAPDGTYSIMIFATDDGGNSFFTEFKDLVLDNRETKAYITSEYNGISPNNDGILDHQIFQINASVVDNILDWSFDVVEKGGVNDGLSVYSISGQNMKKLPEEIIWEGTDENGNVYEGTFVGTLSIVYNNGNNNISETAPFISTAIPPALNVTTAPKYFSPDNDGVDDELFINLTCNGNNISNWSFVIKDPKGNDFWTTSGTLQITNSIVWDGLSNTQKNRDGNAERVQSAMDYPFVFTVTDELGMTSIVEGIIPVDVLVIRDGDVLKMAVPSIIFESDSSNFQNVSKKLSKDKVTKNIQILDRIAAILKKFSDYKVTIVGHANKLTDNPDEETVDNLKEWGRASKPLSKERADAIKDYLVKKGVKESALTTDGLGGTKPIADHKDRNNNWKNRRVEFILTK